MPKAKPVSLHPLSSDQTIDALIPSSLNSKNPSKKQAQKSNARGPLRSLTGQHQ